MLTIRHITRGSVEFEYDGKIAVIAAEAFVREGDSPDFVLYGSTLKRWAPPHDAKVIDRALRKVLLKELQDAFAARGMIAEVE